MNDELVFMIDLDGTLKTDMDTDGPFETPSFSVQAGKKGTYSFAIRPHAHEFLKAAKEKGHVYLSTAGGAGYATKVLNALGLESYFERLYTAEKFMNGIPFFPNVVFIDNSNTMGQLKVEKMQGQSHRKSVRQDLWIVDTYNGGPDDTTLLEAIDDIKKL